MLKLWKIPALDQNTKQSYRSARHVSLAETTGSGSCQSPVLEAGDTSWKVSAPFLVERHVWPKPWIASEHKSFISRCHPDACQRVARCAMRGFFFSAALPVLERYLLKHGMCEAPHLQEFECFGFPSTEENLASRLKCHSSAWTATPLTPSHVAFLHAAGRQAQGCTPQGPCHSLSRSGGDSPTER